MFDRDKVIFTVTVSVFRQVRRDRICRIENMNDGFYLTELPVS